MKVAQANLTGANLRIRRLAIATKRSQAYVHRFLAFVCIVRKMGNFDHELAIDFDGKCSSKRAFASEPPFYILFCLISHQFNLHLLLICRKTIGNN